MPRGHGKRAKTLENVDIGVKKVRADERPNLKELIAASAAANCRSQHSEIIFRLIQSFEAEKLTSAKRRTMQQATK